MSSPLPTFRNSAPKIKSKRETRDSDYEGLLALVEARDKMDVRSCEHKRATKDIEAMIDDLRALGLLCECCNECTDLRSFEGSPKKL